MTQRSKWTAIPGLLALAIGAVVLSAYSGASSSQGFGPEQPVQFPHPRHAGAVKDGGLGLNCLYCHNAGNKSFDVGMPAVYTCLGCHTSVRGATDRAKTEIGKLVKFADARRPVPWIRIHKVPEYVHFPHVRHVNAGVTCQTCHGQVQKMDRVYQYSSLNMGWCVNCHVNGYDPKEGQKAAGYDNVPPANYAGGAPYGTPGTVAGIATTGAGMTPPGMGLPRDTARSTSTATPSAERRRARYDCASCHY
ncbi:MAG: cytochrome c3 family protein [Gemmatimonadaceae bacterium]|nr:cytochrome c3 family protein [Gemmatimonadaceae bacterium]